jgi:hypothetical protein
VDGQGAHCYHAASGARPCSLLAYVEWEPDEPLRRIAPTPERTTRAIAVALVVAALVGVIWGYFPLWSFWCAIGCGFGVAEGIVRFAGVTRGSAYQTIGMLAVLLCVVISRAIITWRLGLGVGDILNILGRNRIDSPTSNALLHAIAFDLANLVYIGLALAIPWYRFR